MNVYIVVEGEKTEMTVYPEWLSIIAYSSGYPFSISGDIRSVPS